MIIKEFKVLTIQTGMGKNWIFVLLISDSGLIGLGEASQSGDDQQVRWLLEQKLLPRLIGLDPVMDGNLFIQQIVKRKLGQRVDGFQENTAISSIEQALWDLRAQNVNLPIYNYFGGRLRTEIPLYANLNRALVDRSPESFGSLAMKAVKDGFKAVKCTPFDGVTPFLARNQWIEKVRDGINRIAAVRECIGVDVDLMVDCHGRFSAADAIWLIKELEQFDLYWVEDPIWSTEDLDQLREVRRKTEVRLAGGERVRGLHEAQLILRDRLLDVIMPDVKHCLGVTSWFHIAAMAEAMNIGIAPHNPAGPVSTAFSAQLCAIIPNLVWLEFPYSEVPWRNTVVTPEENISNGVYRLSESPGNGLQLNLKGLEQHTS